jgi:hypothetical protein
MNRFTSPPRMTGSHSRRLARVAQTVILTGLLLVPQLAAAVMEYVPGVVPFEQAAASGFPAKTYLRVTRLDVRLCPAPTCGGLFVERVNRGATRCADGVYREECYAGLIDLSALGLSSGDEAQLLSDFGGQQVLVRGELELLDWASGVEATVLVVTDAWRGATGSMQEIGRYWGIVPTGINCFTFPCPTLLRQKLNGRRTSWLHGLDLSTSGATQEEIGDALTDLHQGPGLIVFGRKRQIFGPAGQGIELVASEFYQKVEP